MTVLPELTSIDRAEAWAREHVGDLAVGPWRRSSIRGGQGAADAALAGFPIRGYARRRNQVWPAGDRGASGLSPYIRHGLLSLPRVWNAVEGGPDDDVTRFRDELLWQEYARHLYARLGGETRRSLRFAVEEHDAGPGADDPWRGDEACLSLAWTELTTQGWLPNQTRMWLASHWSVRSGRGWREGEDRFFRLLLDGSRAANRVGWQWTIGALTGKPYGFSRWQVEKRAPGLCSSCLHESRCPIQEWPPDDPPEARPVTDPRMRRDPDVGATSGPGGVQRSGVPEEVWITAESLGTADPALAAHPDLPVVFVFDEPLLRALRLSPGRLVFLVECLADLAQRRTVTVERGAPAEVLAGRRLAVTFAGVPGWRRLAAHLDPAEVHPWPWLVPPHAGSVTSFTAWRRAGGRIRIGASGG